MGHKGYYGQYTGNAKWSRNHADTKVTKSNYKASERDDAAHIDYLKRDIDYDNKHGHSDENMTADEKHISKLAGDMKYDKEHHGSPAHGSGEYGDHDMGAKYWEAHKQTKHGRKVHGGPNMNSPVEKAADAGRSGHPRHMQSGADNSGNPNAASSDEYWRKHQQLRHHQSAPTKHINEHMDKDHPHNKRKDHDESIHSHKGKRGKNQSKAVAKMLSPLNNEGHGGKEGHMHMMIKKKKGKLKPIINKKTGERLPEELPKKK